MLTVDQPKLFSRDLVLYDGDSQAAAIHFRMFSSEADIRVGGATYEASRSGWFRGLYTLAQRGKIVASAEATGLWRRVYEVRVDSTAWALRRRPGWFATGWQLLSDDSVVGSVSRTGFFRTRTVAEFDRSVDVAVQVFVVWIVNEIWRQDEAGAAAAAG